MTLHAMQAAGLISSNIDLVKAAVLGFVEGLTEYLPVSSTGHLLLMERILGWGDDAFGKSFAMLIQLGAILALLTIYFGRLWNLARNMFTDWAAARFVIGVLLAFLPAAVIGALAYPIIKAYLFDVRIVCVALIVGGFILLLGRPARPQAALPRSDRLHAADVFRHRRLPVLLHDSRRVARGRDHRQRHAVRRRPPLGGGVLVLAGDADHGRRLRLRGLQGSRRASRSQHHC